MEYCDAGAVGDIMRKRALSEQEIGIITLQLLRALDYLHTLNLCHRDVKAMNILLSSKGRAKLGTCTVLYYVSDS